MNFYILLIIVNFHIHFHKYMLKYLYRLYLLGGKRMNQNTKVFLVQMMDQLNSRFDNLEKKFKRL